MPEADFPRQSGQREVRTTRSAARADEWALVLAAEGLTAAIERNPAGLAICVPAQDHARASAALASYEAENPHDEEPVSAPIERIGDVDQIVAVIFSTALVCFFALTGPVDLEVSWFAAGSGDAGKILAGEFARTVTALSLHADIEHVLANALFGGLFLAAACAGFGPGLAFTLTLLAGAGGNLVNAIFQGPDHTSIGASTAVFGTVGLLAGRGLAQRIRTGKRGLRRWVPIAAGLALFAMFGMGARSDVWAHLFGFLAGGPIGTLATLAGPAAPRPSIQLALGLAAIASIFLCWRVALA